MANSLIDQAQQIFLVGEVGLAAIHALGINVGKVERSETNKEEYESLKYFFNKVFEKAYERQVAIMLPTDFVVSKKIDFTPS
jgi:3-phosphoglycerate kinase